MATAPSWDELGGYFLHVCFFDPDEDLHQKLAPSGDIFINVSNNWEAVSQQLANLWARAIARWKGLVMQISKILVFNGVISSELDNPLDTCDSVTRHTNVLPLSEFRKQDLKSSIDCCRHLVFSCQSHLYFLAKFSAILEVIFPAPQSVDSQPRRATQKSKKQKPV